MENRAITPEQALAVKQPEREFPSKKPQNPVEKIANLPLCQAQRNYLTRRHNHRPFPEKKIDQLTEKEVTDEMDDQKVGIHEGGHRVECSVNHWHNHKTTVKRGSGYRGAHFSSPPSSVFDIRTAKQAIRNAQAGYIAYEICGVESPKQGANSDIGNAMSLAEAIAERTNSTPEAVYAEEERSTYHDLSARRAEILDVSYQLAEEKEI